MLSQEHLAYQGDPNKYVRAIEKEIVTQLALYLAKRFKKVGFKKIRAILWSEIASLRLNQYFQTWVNQFMSGYGRKLSSEGIMRKVKASLDAQYFTLYEEFFTKAFNELQLSIPKSISCVVRHLVRNTARYRHDRRIRITSSQHPSRTTRVTGNVISIFSTGTLCHRQGILS